MADNLPRGALNAAKVGLTSVASDFGHDGLIAGYAHTLARAALTAALPLIERDVRRQMARQVLALNDLDSQQAAATNNRGPFYDMRTSLRKLARGEELADAQAAWEQLSEVRDVPATPGSDHPS